MARRKVEGCELNMTPMIDVVFQLIIFFVVTIKLDSESNPDIRLEKAPHGIEIEGQQPPTTITIEVNNRGWISMRGAQLTKERLRDMMQNRYRKYGEFPVLIRGDRRTKHADIKSVMDICTASGLWRINFVAIKEERKGPR
jgi:biopolymer transport protein ExbD